MERPRLDAEGAEPGEPVRSSPAARVVKVTASTSDGDMAPERDAVGDPMGDGTGLAGAGAGEHADRAVETQRDLALLGVEPVEQAIGVVHRCLHTSIAA